MRTISYLVAEHLLNYGKIAFHTKGNSPISEEKAKKFDTILDRLINYEPVQYILGWTEFYGLPFKVDRRALIPRQETEELVDLVIRSEKGSVIDIMDIGTGSGCIAVALDKFLPDARVSACDMSQDILDLARENSMLNGADISIFRHDILDESAILPERYHVVVSNPPYVRNSEQSTMRRNVLDFEPAVALFVHDGDPLIFYRYIARQCRSALQPGGRLYMEINEAFPEEVKGLLMAGGFNMVRVYEDLNGKPRIIRAVLGEGKAG